MTEEEELNLRATGSIEEYLLLERAFCRCQDDGLCTCGWDDA